MSRPVLPPIVVIAIAACALLPSAAAAQTVIYRCTDAKGAVTMQNDKPCGPGMQQQIRTVGVLPTAPAPVRKAEAPPLPAGPPLGSRFELVRGPVTQPLPASSVPDAERKAPPTLYQCETWDRDQYLGDTAEPAPRCVPLRTVGLDGSAAMAGGQACEVKQDRCAALTGEALCQAWHRRVDEAQFRLKFTTDAERATRQSDYDRLARILADSSCR